MPYNADFFIERLLNYYNVGTISELSKLINIKQTSISSWRARNSINAIKKKCRELGIYNDIFGNSTSQIINDNHGNLAQTVKGDQFNNSKEDTTKKKDNIDKVTYGLFEEAYDEAIKENKLNAFRIYLMEKNF